MQRQHECIESAGPAGLYSLRRWIGEPGFSTLAAIAWSAIGSPLFGAALLVCLEESLDDF